MIQVFVIPAVVTPNYGDVTEKTVPCISPSRDKPVKFYKVLLYKYLTSQITTPIHGETPVVLTFAAVGKSSTRSFEKPLVICRGSSSAPLDWRTVVVRLSPHGSR